MPTVTTNLSSVAVGATASNASNAYRLALQAKTSHISLTALLTNGSRAGNPQKEIIVRWAVYPGALSGAADGPTQLGSIANSLRVLPNSKPGGINAVQSPIILTGGTHLFLWLEEPVLDAAGTLSVYSTELQLET